MSWPTCPVYSPCRGCRSCGRWPCTATLCAWDPCTGRTSWCTCLRCCSWMTCASCQPTSRWLGKACRCSRAPPTTAQVQWCHHVALFSQKPYALRPGLGCCCDQCDHTCHFIAVCRLAGCLHAGEDSQAQCAQGNSDFNLCQAGHCLRMRFVADWGMLQTQCQAQDSTNFQYLPATHRRWTSTPVEQTEC